MPLHGIWLAEGLIGRLGRASTHNSDLGEAFKAAFLAGLSVASASFWRVRAPETEVLAFDCLLIIVYVCCCYVTEKA